MTAEIQKISPINPNEALGVDNDSDNAVNWRLISIVNDFIKERFNSKSDWIDITVSEIVAEFEKRYRDIKFTNYDSIHDLKPLYKLYGWYVYNTYPGVDENFEAYLTFKSEKE